MPIDLVAQRPAAAALQPLPVLTFVAQLAAIIVIAGALVVLGSFSNGTLAGSAQDIVAAP